jgi:hypothetical protein
VQPTVLLLNPEPAELFGLKGPIQLQFELFPLFEKQLTYVMPPTVALEPLQLVEPFGHLQGAVGQADCA